MSASRLTVVVLKGYPRLSETFIAQELLALERAGERLHFFSLRHPTDGKLHPVHRAIRAPVTYLPEYLYQEPLRVIRSLARAARLPRFRSAFSTWFGDLRRDPTPNRVRRFGQACVLATEMPPATSWLYAHFIHTPAAVTRYAALMTGLPWSCSAHAKDIWTSPAWQLAAHLADAQWLTTCTRAGRDHLVHHTTEVHKVHLVYHGIDLSRFPLPPAQGRERDGSDPVRPVRLLAVGRAVEKKGLDTLLAALQLLPATLHWSLVHVGGGGTLPALERQAQALGLAARVTWRGAQDQATVLEAYRSADIFVLPCRIAHDGDRDGLPNVLLEAQSQGLACVSTPVGGVPELIIDGETGALVPPDDPVGLARALEMLIRDPDLRQRLGRAGARRVRDTFDAPATFARLLALFRGDALAMPPAKEPVS